jgi:hypothetical protein
MDVVGLNSAVLGVAIASSDANGETRDLQDLRQRLSNFCGITEAHFYVA